MSKRSQSLKSKPEPTAALPTWESTSASQAFMKASVDAFVLFDENLNLLSLNPAAERLVSLSQVSSGVITGKHIQSFRPEMRESDRYEEYRKVLKTGKPFFTETAVHHPERGEMHISIKAFKAGACLGIIVSDITQRNQTEQALRESEEKYRLLFDNSPLGLCHFDRKGVVTTCNDNLARILGAPKEKVIGIDMLSTFKDERQLEALKTALSGGTGIFEGDYVSVTGGKLSTIRTLYAPIFRMDGSLSGGIGIVEDITERKRAEDALTESEHRFRALFEGAPDAMFLADPKSGKIVDVNPAASRLLLKPREEIIGLHQSQLHPPQLDGYSRQQFGEHVKQSKQRIPVRNFVIRSDGSEIAIEIVAHMIQVEGKQLLLGTFRDISERQLIEEALYESEEKYRNLVETSQDLIFQCDLEGRFTYLNKAWEDVIGYELKEMLGHKFIEFEREDLIERDFRTFEDIVEGKPRYRHETVYISREGKEVHLVFSAMRLHDGSGATIGTQGAAFDITEHKRAEEELKEYRDHLEELVRERTIELEKANEQLSREINERTEAENELKIKDFAISSSIDAIGMCDLKGSMIYANSSLLKLWGYGETREVLGKQASDFWRDKEQISDVIAALYKKGNWQGQTVGLRKDGSTFHVFLACHAVKDEAGTPVCLMASCIDITEQKRSEEALRKSEERFRSLIENAFESVVILDNDGAVRYQSPSLAKLSGYEAEELPGKNLFEFLHPDYIADVSEAFKRLIKNPGSMINIELCGLHGDGSWHFIEATGQNLFHDPAVEGIVVNFRDITERRKTREKLQELYNQEKTLRQDLEAEMKKRIEFTRALAHELKTPLTPVVISSQVLASELKEEPLLSLARNINRGASNLNSRIDELLDLAKGEIGMLQLKSDPLDMLQLIREVAEDVAPLASSHGQTVILELPATVLPVKADHVRVRQIMLNLLNNAFKFTPAGGTITVRSEEKDACLTVEVQDTGPGIARKEQKRLFEPYQRLKAKGETLSGLGLGLALCKMLVELHGGKIWLKSRVGRGSTFGFTLPQDMGKGGTSTIIAPSIPTASYSS